MERTDRTPLWLPTPSDTDRYFGPYRVIRKIGAGGMGIVYLGVDPTDRPVAIKVLREFIAEDLQARARLDREVATLRRVRHRCVAAVIDADLDGESPYLVTEFVHGPQLDAYVDKVGPLSRAGLVNLGNGLIGALRAIHEVDVVHRDLKPGNVMLREDTPVVIDFGIAQAADDIRLTVSGLFVGTPGYVAPEVIDGVRSTTATDWWGWAATMAFAATGKPPAGRGPLEVVLDRIRRGRLDLEDVDDDLRPLLEQTLSPEPGDRPTVGRLMDQFDRYAAGKATGAPRQQSVAAPAIDTQRSTPMTRAEKWIEKARSHAASPGPRMATSVMSQSHTPAPAQSKVEPPLPAFLSPRRDEGPPTTGLPTPQSEQNHGPPGPVAAPPTHNGTQARRTLTALGFLVLVLGAGWPVITAILMIIWVVSARFADRVWTHLATKRERRGPKRTDLVRETALSPWHFTVAGAKSAASLILPFLIGSAVALVGIQILQALEYGERYGEPGKNVALMLGFAAALAIAWKGPGSAALRRSSTRMITKVAPDRYGSRVAIVLFAVAAVILAALIVAFPAVTWWPLDGSALPGGLA